MLLKPEVMVFRAAEHFDDAGELVDEATREHVAAQLRELVAWVRLLTGAPRGSAAGS